MAARRHRLVRLVVAEPAQLLSAPRTAPMELLAPPEPSAPASPAADLLLIDLDPKALYGAVADAAGRGHRDGGR